MELERRIKMRHLFLLNWCSYYYIFWHCRFKKLKMPDLLWLHIYFILSFLCHNEHLRYVKRSWQPSRNPFLQCTDLLDPTGMCWKRCENTIWSYFANAAKRPMAPSAQTAVNVWPNETAWVRVELWPGWKCVFLSDDSPWQTFGNIYQQQ